MSLSFPPKIGGSVPSEKDPIAIQRRKGRQVQVELLASSRLRTSVPETSSTIHHDKEEQTRWLSIPDAMAANGFVDEDYKKSSAYFQNIWDGDSFYDCRSQASEASSQSSASFCDTTLGGARTPSNRQAARWTFEFSPAHSQRNSTERSQMKDSDDARIAKGHEAELARFNKTSNWFVFERKENTLVTPSSHQNMVDRGHAFETESQQGSTSNWETPTETESHNKVAWTSPSLQTDKLEAEPTPHENGGPANVLVQNMFAGFDFQALKEAPAFPFSHQAPVEGLALNEAAARDPPTTIMNSVQTSDFGGRGALQISPPIMDLHRIEKHTSGTTNTTILESRTTENSDQRGGEHVDSSIPNDLVDTDARDEHAEIFVSKPSLSFGIDTEQYESTPQHPFATSMNTSNNQVAGGTPSNVVKQLNFDQCEQNQIEHPKEEPRLAALPGTFADSEMVKSDVEGVGESLSVDSVTESFECEKKVDAYDSSNCRPSSSDNEAQHSTTDSGEAFDTLKVDDNLLHSDSNDSRWLVAQAASRSDDHSDTKAAAAAVDPDLSAVDAAFQGMDALQEPELTETFRDAFSELESEIKKLENLGENGIYDTLAESSADDVDSDMPLLLEGNQTKDTFSGDRRRPDATQDIVVHRHNEDSSVLPPLDTTKEEVENTNKGAESTPGSMVDKMDQLSSMWDDIKRQSSNEAEKDIRHDSPASSVSGSLSDEYSIDNGILLRNDELENHPDDESNDGSEIAQTPRKLDRVNIGRPPPRFQQKSPNRKGLTIAKAPSFETDRRAAQGSYPRGSLTPNKIPTPMSKRTPRTSTSPSTPRSLTSVTQLHSGRSAMKNVTPRKADHGHMTIMCPNSFVDRLHDKVGPCDRCWSLATPGDRARFQARGTHLLIQRTRGGCKKCKLFPPANGEEAMHAVRLCRKCFTDTHVKDFERLQVYRGNHRRLTPSS